MCLNTLLIIIVMAIVLGFAVKLPFFLRESKSQKASLEQESATPTGPYSPTSRDLAMLPVALLVGFAFASCKGICLTLGWLVSAIFHECGHALLYWVQGNVAVPWILFTIPLGSRSLLVSLMLIAGAVARSYFAQRRERYLLSALGWGIAALTILFSFVLSEETGRMAMYYGGLGGELFLSTLAMALFYERLGSDRTTRYVLLFLGASCFTGAVTRWTEIAAGVGKLPWGAALDFKLISTGESGGDLDVLMRDFHWTEQDILQSYLTTAWWAGGVLTAFYLWQLFRFLNRRSATSQY